MPLRIDSESWVGPMSAQSCTLQWPMDDIQHWASVVLAAGRWLAQCCNTMMAKRCYNVANNVFSSVTHVQPTVYNVVVLSG